MDYLPDGFEPANLIYLLILLIGIGSFVFGDFRNQLSRNLQHASIWVLIFFSAIVMYSFKDTIEAQLFPTSSVQQIGDDIVLTRASDGHFHATLTVNGQEVRFIVDTGATGVVLNQADAKRVGLDPENLAYLGRARTANGSVATADVRLKDVRLGDRLDKNLRASVNAGELDTSLLGMTYLSRFSTIEISGNTLRLIP